MTRLFDIDGSPLRRDVGLEAEELQQLAGLDRSHGPPTESLTEPPQSEATAHRRTADVDSHHFQPTVCQPGDHDV